MMDVASIDGKMWKSNVRSTGRNCHHILPNSYCIILWNTECVICVISSLLDHPGSTVNGNIAKQKHLGTAATQQ